MDPPITLEKFTRKKKRRSKSTAYTGNSKYDVVRSCIKRAGMSIIEDEGKVDDQCLLYWMDTGVYQETVMKLSPWQKVNHFPGMHEICRKDNLTRNLNKMRRLFPSKDFNFYPKSWWLPTDYMDFVRYAKSHAKLKATMFIAKPDSSSQGRGIFLFKNPLSSTLPVEINEKTNDLIVQKYISKPLLIDGYKFDFRVYVLVTSCDPLRIFVHKEGLARFATCPYENPGDKNADNVFMHLTNYAINKKNQNFDRNSDKGSKRTLSSVLAMLREKGHDVDKMWNDMCDSIVKTLLVVHPYLVRNYRAGTAKLKRKQTQMQTDGMPTCKDVKLPNPSQCFELLGFDIMLDRKLKPWVLEVNHSPSLTCDAKIDLEVKSEVIFDCLRLVGLDHASDGSSRKMYHEFRRQIRKHDKWEANRRLFSSRSAFTTIQSAKTGLDEDAQKVIDDWEDANIGSFERIYPTSSPEKAQKYDLYLDKAENLVALDRRETNATKGRKAALEEKRRMSDPDVKFCKWKKRQDSLRSSSCIGATNSQKPAMTPSSTRDIERSEEEEELGDDMLRRNLMKEFVFQSLLDVSQYTNILKTPSEHSIVPTAQVLPSDQLLCDRLPAITRKQSNFFVDDFRNTPSSEPDLSVNIRNSLMGSAAGNGGPNYRSAKKTVHVAEPPALNSLSPKILKKQIHKAAEREYTNLIKPLDLMEKRIRSLRLDSAYRK